MKFISDKAILFSLLFVIAINYSCKKDELGYIEKNVPPLIYLTNTVDGKVNIAASNKNVVIDKVAKTATAYLGINRSGIQDKEAYSVKFATSTSNLPGGVVPLSANDYTVIAPGKTGSVGTIDVPAGETSSEFSIKISKAVFDANAGKKIGLTVTLSEPSKYELNTKLSSAPVIIDVSSFANSF
jgi:hypothetical protein